jgi:hypothetical protein
MRTMTVLAGAFGCAFFIQAALAAPPALPAKVAGDLKDLAAQCSDAGGKPVTGDAVRQADLNGDGQKDYVLFAGWIVCEGAYSIYGDRAKYVQVYAGDAQGGATGGFAASAYDVRIEESATPSRVWLGVSGATCGKPQAATFAEEAFCDRPLAWNAKARQFEFAPVSTVRMIQ